MSMHSQTESLDDHGKAMDRMYRFQRHIYDASRRYYLLGRDRMIDELRPPLNGSILEIGCGTGRNLLRAARRFNDAKLFGVDISQEMLKSAITTMQRHCPNAGVQFACVDATSFDPGLCLGHAKFDRIYFSYTLSMVPQWQAALANALTMLAPRGELHVVDFGQSENLGSGFRNLLFRWLAAFHVTPRPDLKATLTRLARENSLKLHFRSRFGGYAWVAALKPQAEFQ
jgi:S-adenosylmethionine-diacylgycerolhomoserine-N-methlytransferase